jgi:hypothetical protein
MSSEKSGNTNLTLDIGSLISLWTLLAIVCHCAELGMFKDWPIIDWPNHWSCMCIFLWSFIVVIGILAILCIFLAIASILRKRQDRKKLKAHVKTLRDAGMTHEADMLEKRLIKDGIMKDGSSKA